MDDIRLWVDFAHQAAQPLPEAGGKDRRPQLRPELHKKKHGGGRESGGIHQVQDFPPATYGPPPLSLDHVLFLLHFGKGGHLVLEQIKVSRAAL